MEAKKWRRRPDLNRWLYGFANRSLGPLGHVSPLIEGLIIKKRPSIVNELSAYFLIKRSTLKRPGPTKASIIAENM